MSDHTEATLTAAILKTWTLNALRPRYVTAIQVNNGAGFAYGRTLDAVVFDTWPSAGLHLHGLEIKCTKADLRRELQDTRKFAEFAPLLDLFSIVAPKGIADLSLLPPKWGLYCPNSDGGLRARRKPLMLHDKGKQKSIDRSLAAAFARALVSRSLSDEGKKAEYERCYANGERKMEREVDSLNRNLTLYKQAFEDFEEKSGVRISKYGAGEIGEAVDFVLRGEMKGVLRFMPNVKSLGERLIKLADELEDLKDGRITRLSDTQATPDRH